MKYIIQICNESEHKSLGRNAINSSVEIREKEREREKEGEGGRVSTASLKRHRIILVKAIHYYDGSISPAA